MLKTKRIHQIQEYVLKHETVSLDELVEVFGVSKNTIRRDVQVLVEHGDLKKVYGGVAVNHSTLVSFNDRKVRNQTEKTHIAKLAANYVNDGDIIFIDSGTTTFEMFHFVKEKNITVVTNNVDFIVESMPYKNLNIFSTGGMLERETKSFTSYKGLDLFKTYNINKAFMASTGISISNGVTNSAPLESELKSSAVKKCSQVFLLVDHGKFDKYALTTYCNLDEIHYLITDKEPNENYQLFALEHNIILNY
ncbi:MULTISPECIES: DeoR/GlpR family DNA-binding transcription regulator [Metabacillus]|uniref:DeoR/GlpR family DNA-binding transcription regulator n=1 Tax=Metabacillus endolithicus TaxID=1535204 RepID=A0ABW5C4Z9_9BACI|nr:DeoR/GlpR family DNA-binding transcription regulator [Metabacillus endolithicus]UPG61969.1 DeoR/GlpR family DNA-binding transcription regulator [Metabacillus endolithicus]